MSCLLRLIAVIQCFDFDTWTDTWSWRTLLAMFEEMHNMAV